MFYVSAVLLCGFCGQSGPSKCSIIIKVPSSGAPVWETKCTYQHPFRYGFAVGGWKNKPCRNVPVRCELCHPQLPPEPGRYSRRVLAVPVDVVWCYNLAEHITMIYEEYLVPRDNPGPGLDINRVSLPASMKETMKITDLEYTTACIPNDYRPASHLPSTEHDKENVPSSSSRTPKRSALNPAGLLPSTRVHIAVSILQLSCTLVV